MINPPEQRKDFARLLMEKAGVRQNYASELAGGLKSPSLRLAIQIEDATGISARYWVDRQRESV